MGNNKINLFIGAAVVVVVAGLGIIFYASGKTNNDSAKMFDNGTVAGASTQGKSSAYLEALAKHLSEKGMVLYGAYWCPHCKDQKAAFGDAFKYIDYVECDAKGPNANPDECVAKKIEGYPTWIYQDKQYSGFQSLDKLAEITGFVWNETE